MSTTKAFPCAWPIGWKRAPIRTTGRFAKNGNPISVSEGVMRVLAELEKMKVSRDDVVISTNVELRLDGLPRSDRPEPPDPAVAVYWRPRGTNATKVMAIDAYTRVGDNLAAIAATLDAMRAIERHGGAAILDRAFSGFSALPSPDVVKTWREVFGVPQDRKITVEELKRLFRVAASINHPDKNGGSHYAMTQINDAYRKGLEELT